MGTIQWQHLIQRMFSDDNLHYDFLTESFLVSFPFPWLILCTLYVQGVNGGGNSELFGIIEVGGLAILFITAGAQAPIGLYPALEFVVVVLFEEGY